MTPYLDLPVLRQDDPYQSHSGIHPSLRLGRHLRPFLRWGCNLDYQIWRQSRISLGPSLLFPPSTDKGEIGCENRIVFLSC